jgi:hypothetical protein
MPVRSHQQVSDFVGYRAPQQAQTIGADATRQNRNAIRIDIRDGSRCRLPVDQRESE